MPTYLEAWQPAGVERAQLDADSLTIGKGPTNNLVVRDSTVSRLHAVVERFPAGWVVRDLGSRNGTFVNGERITTERVLHGGDEIRVGGARLVFRADADLVGTSSTAAADPAPALTARERDVLLALCRPILAGDVLTQPATAQGVAAALVLSEDAVKKHLQRLYRKFDLAEVPPSLRRARLANDALRRGAVSIGDLDG